MKTLVTVLLAAVIFALLAACRGDDPTSTPQPLPTNTPTNTPANTPTNTPNDSASDPPLQPLVAVSPEDGGGVTVFTRVNHEVTLDWSVGTPPYTVDLSLHGVQIDQFTGLNQTRHTFTSTIDNTEGREASREDEYVWNVTDSAGRTFASPARFTVQWEQPGG